jgi:hypothetical protein
MPGLKINPVAAWNIAAMIDPGNPTTRAAAVHEAGHAVIGRSLGIHCGGASIRPTKVELGHAAIGDPLDGWHRGDGPRRELAEEVVISLYAGAEAERVLLRSQLCSDADDVALARPFLANYLGAARDTSHANGAAAEEKLRRRARELISGHRDEILRVADALLAHESLSGKDIDRLLATHVAAKTNGSGELATTLQEPHGTAAPRRLGETRSPEVE